LKATFVKNSVFFDAIFEEIDRNSLFASQQSF